jgi:hypothetical protein
MKFGKFEIYHQKLIFAITGNTKNVFNFEFYTFYLGASLCALSKKEGGMRPIAIESTFRCLSSK